jgi:hypothetical protein
MFTSPRVVVAGAVLAASALLLAACASGSQAASTSAPSAEQAELAELQSQLSEYADAEALVEEHLATFDELDFEVFSNQDWERLHESHSEDVKVVWPDGHGAEGIDTHIDDLAALFVHAPDTRIKQHPVGFGVVDMTVVEGVFEGTLTEPMPDGTGGFIQPTGKAFKMPTATIDFWRTAS